MYKYSGGKKALFTGLGTAVTLGGLYQVGKRTLGETKHTMQSMRSGLHTNNPYYSDSTGKLLKSSEMDKLAEEIYGVSGTDVPRLLGRYNFKNNRRI